MSTESTSFPYEVIEEYIRGGCSVLYRIKPHDEAKRESGKEYVLKTMTFSEDDPQSHQRFYMEYEFLRAYPHPNLIEVEDYFPNWQDRPAYVMELVKGDTWQNYWRDRKIEDSIPEFLDLFKQLCDVLDYVHKHQIIHRDLNPQNILISSENKLKLIDFGIMKVADMTLYTQRNTFMGSAYYVSPEGVSGDTVSHTADIFSLGVMIYDLFTGLKPFKGPTLGETIYQRLVKKPEPPSQISEVPPELDPIILKMLERDPRMRYQSCGHIYSEMEQLLKSYRPQVKLEDQPKIDILTRSHLLHGPFIDRCKEALDESRVLLLVAPEGTGKTTIAENLIATHFRESPLRLTCHEEGTQFEFMEIILSNISTVVRNKPELSQWIEILGSALPALQWKSLNRHQSLSHSTILTAFQRLLFSIEDSMVLIVEELHDAPTALSRFLVHLCQLLKSSSNKQITLIMTSQKKLEDFAALVPIMSVEFPDVITLSEYLADQFDGCRISLDITTQLAKLSKQNIARFCSLVKEYRNLGRLKVKEDVLVLGAGEPMEMEKTVRISRPEPVGINSKLPEPLLNFAPGQLRILQWVALCPEGVDLSRLQAFTGSEWSELGETIEKSEQLNLLEFQSGTTEGFRWKNKEVRDFLFNSLNPNEKVERYARLAAAIEEESRQFLSYSPPLWMMLARLYLLAENPGKAAEYAIGYARYCFQNGNYEPIRNHLVQFTDLDLVSRRFEFWYMLAFAFSGNDLDQALKFARRALSIEGNIQSLSLMTLLEYYAFNLNRTRDFLRRTFEHSNLADIQLPLAAKLIPVAIALNEETKAKTLFQSISGVLGDRDDLFAINTLALARAQLLRAHPTKVLDNLTQPNKNLLPKTQAQLRYYACMAHQERFDYSNAITCLNVPEQNQPVDTNRFRELLFLELNFLNLGKVKNLISQFQKAKTEHLHLKSLDPLFQLGTEILIKDPKIYQLQHLVQLLHQAKVEKTSWLCLFATVLDFRSLDQRFMKRLVEILEAAAVPWARNQLLRLKMLAALQAGHHIEVAYLFQKAMRKAKEQGLVMEKMRLFVLRDFLVKRKLLPESYQVELPGALLNQEDVQRFLMLASLSSGG